MFPSGQARVATKPVSNRIGIICAITMGILIELLFWQDGSGNSAPPPVTRTSTLKRTSSAASAGRRSGFSSAYRYSMTIICFLYHTQARADPAGKPRGEPIDRQAWHPFKITNPRNVLWLLRVAGRAKRKEHGAKSKDRDFFLPCLSL